MAQIFDEDISFFNLLYTDEVYAIKTKKYATSLSLNSDEGLKEELVAYHSPDLNFKGITSPTLLLFNYQEEDGITDPDQVFLNQVLKAVGQNFENLSWLNTANLPQNIKWQHIAAQSPCEIVIAFGINGHYLPDGILEAQILNVNGKRILIAPSLSEIAVDSSKKKLLWQGLKEIYGL